MQMILDGDSLEVVGESQIILVLEHTKVIILVKPQMEVTF